jgi:hypothetical protein
MMNDHSHLIVHPDFQRTLEELRSRDVFLPPEGEAQNFSGTLGGIVEPGKVTALEEVSAYPVDASSGHQFAREYTLCAYDESWLRFDALEGTAYFTTHALALVRETDYVPVVLATFYFYTRSQTMTAQSKFVGGQAIMSLRVRRNVSHESRRVRVQLRRPSPPSRCSSILSLSR